MLPFGVKKPYEAVSFFLLFLNVMGPSWHDLFGPCVVVDVIVSWVYSIFWMDINSSFCILFDMFSECMNSFVCVCIVVCVCVCFMDQLSWHLPLIECVLLA